MLGRRGSRGQNSRQWAPHGLRMSYSGSQGTWLPVSCPSPAEATGPGPSGQQPGASPSRPAPPRKPCTASRIRGVGPHGPWPTFEGLGPGNESCRAGQSCAEASGMWGAGGSEAPPLPATSLAAKVGIPRRADPLPQMPQMMPPMPPHVLSRCPGWTRPA